MSAILQTFATLRGSHHFIYRSLPYSRFSCRVTLSPGSFVYLPRTTARSKFRKDSRVSVSSEDSKGDSISYEESQRLRQLPSLVERLQLITTDEEELATELRRDITELHGKSEALKHLKFKRERLQEQLAAEAAANAATARAMKLRAERAEKQRLMSIASRSSSTSSEGAAAFPSTKASTSGKSRRPRLRSMLRKRALRKRASISGVKSKVAKTQALKRAREIAKETDELPDLDVARVFDEDACTLPKPIFVVSDCTGESASNTVRAALGQFEQCTNMSLPTNMSIHRFIDTEKQVHQVIYEASQENALVVYTLADPVIQHAMKSAAHFHQVQAVDLWGSLLVEMESHLQMVRSGVPLAKRSSANKTLSRDYFRMIEAVEYTRKQDDGAMPQHWGDADILLLGVSRTGKTPLSIYLGQRGFKVANLPLVPINDKLHIPKQLYEIDQMRIVGLLIDPEVLQAMRSTRMKAMGVGGERSNTGAYSSRLQCRHEVQLAKDLYQRNPTWPVLDVTHRAVEESAARILQIMAERGRYIPASME